MITFKCSYISSITFKDLLMAGKNSNMTFDCFYSVFFIYYTVFTNNLIVSLHYFIYLLICCCFLWMGWWNVVFSSVRAKIWLYDSPYFRIIFSRLKMYAFFFTLQWQSWMVFFVFFFWLLLFNIFFYIFYLLLGRNRIYLPLQIIQNLFLLYILLYLILPTNSPVWCCLGGCSLPNVIEPSEQIECSE